MTNHHCVYFVIVLCITRKLFSCRLYFRALTPSPDEDASLFLSFLNHVCGSRPIVLGRWDCHQADRRPATWVTYRVATHTCPDRPSGRTALLMYKFDLHCTEGAHTSWRPRFLLLHINTHAKQRIEGKIAKTNTQWIRIEYHPTLTVASVLTAHCGNARTVRVSVCCRAQRSAYD